MRELLQQALEVLKEVRQFASFIPGSVHDRNIAAQESIEAALSRSEWVPVAERLPVVPEGKAYVPVWQADATTGEVIDCDFGKGFGVWDKATHWMYRQDDTPQPPRSEE